MPGLQMGYCGPRAPTHVRGYFQSAYSGELAAQLAAAPTHWRQSSKTGRKRSGHENVITAVESSLVSSPCVNTVHRLKQCKHTHTNTCGIRVDESSESEPGWFSPAVCPHWQRRTIVSLLVLEASFLVQKTLFKQTITETNVAAIRAALGALLGGCT